MIGLLTVTPSIAAPDAPAMGGMDMSQPMQGGMDMRDHATHAGMDMPGHEMSGSMDDMKMSSSVDINDAMSQEASGTAWVPSSTPVYAWMKMKPNGDMLMLHGAIMPRYTDVGSKRGDRRADAPNWFMGMYSHPVGSRDQIGLRAMFSLDPITEGGYGYPLLYQTGESWHGQPLRDRQHPHDLVDELGISYSRLLGGGKSAYLYLAYPGEPALGPPTYMHRLLASDYADAPIGHHWQDATHVTFGVATAGLNFGSKIKLEASNFTGREPDENRYSFDRPRFDSYSTRLSYNPDANNAFQMSYGFVKNPEGDNANVNRTTASWICNRPLGEDANFTTALVWGQNDSSEEGKSQSYLAEADYQNGANTFFARIENIQKSGHELVLPSPYDTGKMYRLGAYSVGYVRDLTHGKGIDTGLGFAVTANTKPSGLDAFYGSGTPVSFQVYLRLRPSRMKGMTGTVPSTEEKGKTDTAQVPMTPQPLPPTVAENPMHGNTPATAGENPAHGETPQPVPATPQPETPATPPSPAAAPVTISSITAVITPNEPKARAKNLVTITVTGSDGKPVTDAVVKADVAMTSMDMGTSHIAFKPLGDGRYQGPVQFSMAGPWRITVTVTPAGGGKPVTKTVDIHVAR